MEVELDRVDLKLEGIFKIHLELETLTHLLIQAPKTSTSYRIGGADNRPVTIQKEYIFGNNKVVVEIPYIPGSSIKGRMRSILELALGKPIWKQDNKIWMHVRNPSLIKGNLVKDLVKDIEERCEIDEIFGSPAISYDKLTDLLKKAKESEEKPDNNNKDSDLGELFRLMAPTRLIVENFYPSKSYVKEMFDRQGVLSFIDFVTEKSENRIDRITATADPRQYLTVKPGVEFEGTLKLLVYNIDKVECPKSNVLCWKRNLLVILNGLRLLEETYIGSSGSRGYGSIKFKNIKLSYLDVSQSPNKLITEKLLVENDSIEGMIKEIEEINPYASTR